MIRFGIIGTNRITEQFIEAGRTCEGFVLSAVYSRTEERAQEFAARFAIPELFTDLESMAKSDSIDAVYIASPNSYHASQAILFMDHGKHVLCEKPLASNVNEVNAMVAAAHTRNVLLMEALKSTLLPNFAAIREHLPLIGPVRRYAASYCQYSSRYDAYKQGTVLNAFNPIFSNGSLMDLGIYCIYPMVVLFGKPLSIQATGLLLDSGVDGQGSLILGYADMDAVITHSKISPSYLPTEIQGENGTLVIDKIDKPNQAEIRYRNGEVMDIKKPQTAETMCYEIQEFIDLLHRGERESTVNSHRHSIWAMEIMDEARRQIGLVFPADQ
ncbi:Gfo/Idh/MocA family protein [Paenibacillus agricola]|uniref:Gfo/Idh/MocA family oxidoreductase n=1 Tax=Paenibacillus agricola TaxID=2716264 RepID=A0ABX0JHQ1_9BACL|nr:Gfo/Idh/MocA family oxidoreductase [Paenibacillus agricola]NHN35361.1 Gfo/Idh/MocA family oxidoreductase [Paenibacillus agricola]